MIPGILRDAPIEFAKYNLSFSKIPSKEVSKILAEEMRVPLKALWSNDENCWLIYRIRDNNLEWQLSLPSDMTVLTSSIKQYLQKYDSTKFGTHNDEERQKDFKYWFDNIRPDKDRKRREKLNEECLYKARDINTFIARKFNRASQHVVPGFPVGSIKKGNRMVPIYAFKKNQLSQGGK